MSVAGRILVFDTSTPRMGVGVLGTTFSERTERIIRGAEQHLVPWALALLEDQPVAAVGVCIGPGAFTGLRVGLATAQGFAHAHGTPMFGFTSLRIRGEHHGVDAVWLDARKGRVYEGFAPGWEPADVDPVARAGTYAGEGAEVYRDRIEAVGSVVANPDDPGLETLARLTQAALNAGESGDPLAVMPLYVRPPDAVPPKRKLKKPTAIG